MSTTFPLSPSDARIAARQDAALAHEIGLQCYCRSCDEAARLEQAEADREALRTAFLSPVTWHQTFCAACEASVIAPEHTRAPLCAECEGEFELLAIESQLD